MPSTREKNQWPPSAECKRIPPPPAQGAPSASSASPHFPFGARAVHAQLHIEGMGVPRQRLAGGQQLQQIRQVIGACHPIDRKTREKSRKPRGAGKGGNTCKETNVTQTSSASAKAAFEAHLSLGCGNLTRRDPKMAGTLEDVGATAAAVSEAWFF